MPYFRGVWWCKVYVKKGKVFSSWWECVCAYTDGIITHCRMSDDMMNGGCVRLG